MKKNISLFFAIILAISSMTSVYAANTEIKVFLDEYSGPNGQKINFDVPPQTINDRTMVPIRAIFEAMGATVVWDDATKTATSTKENTTVKMTLNSTTEYINDMPFEMDVTPVIIDGRTLAPARYVAEAFGYHVNWDKPTSSVLISKNSEFNISQVKDGTKDHPYKFGDKIPITIFAYADDYESKVPKATMNLTIDSLMNFDEIKKSFSEKTYYSYNENDWFIKGFISLTEYNNDDAYSFADLEYDSKAVTNKFTTTNTSSWFSDPTEFKYLSMYEGGEGEVYIHLDTDSLPEGQTFDYFTITYNSGSNYNDKKTIWFSLK